LGYLEQEPKLDENKSVFDNVMEGIAHKTALLTGYEDLCAKLGEEGADIDALCKEQEELQSNIEKAWMLGHSS